MSFTVIVAAWLLIDHLSHLAYSLSGLYDGYHYWINSYSVLHADRQCATLHAFPHMEEYHCDDNTGRHK